MKQYTVVKMFHMQGVRDIPKYCTLLTTRILCKEVNRKLVNSPIENTNRKKCGCSKQEKLSQSPIGKMRLQELIRRLQEEIKDRP